MPRDVTPLLHDPLLRLERVGKKWVSSSDSRLKGCSPVYFEAEKGNLASPFVAYMISFSSPKLRITGDVINYADQSIFVLNSSLICFLLFSESMHPRRIFLASIL